jgi:hypothetical protein
MRTGGSLPVDKGMYRIPGKAKYIQVYESAGMNVKFANSPSPYIYLS